jgi:ABC-type dipeptide/oligopeptide/nickel transport system permease subunit
LTNVIHLFGLPLAATDKQGVFFFGTDRLGRDMFSRMCYGGSGLFGSGQSPSKFAWALQ